MDERDTVEMLDVPLNLTATDVSLKSQETVSIFEKTILCLPVRDSPNM